MKLNLGKELARLQDMSVADLLAKYAEVFDHQPRTRNKPWLLRRIAWRLQALIEGDLSERAHQRAAELANDADLRVIPPREMATPRSNEPTVQLPIAGTVLTREYKGRHLRVTVLESGFEFEGEHFKTLTAVAKAATSQHMSGNRFFGLQGKEAV